MIELGGNDVLAIEQYLTKLRIQTNKTMALQIAVPIIVVRLFSHIFDIFAWTPLSFGHFELMQGYNVPAKNMLPILLGREPSDMGIKLKLNWSDLQPEKLKQIKSISMRLQA